MNKKNLFFTIFFVLIFSISVTSYGVPDFVLDKMEFENGSVFVEDFELKVLHKGLTIDCQYTKCEWELDLIDKVPKGVCINTTHLNFLHEGDPMPKYVYNMEDLRTINYDCSIYDKVDENCDDFEDVCEYYLVENKTCSYQEEYIKEEYCYYGVGHLTGYFVAPLETTGKYDVSLIFNNKEYFIDPTFVTSGTDFNNGTYNKTFLDIDGYLKLTNNDTEQELDVNDGWFNYSDLVAYWKLNNDSSIGESNSLCVDSNNNLNLSCSSCPDRNEDGKLNKADLFGLSNKFWSGGDSSLIDSLSQTITLSVWVKETAGGMGVIDNQGLISKYSATGTQRKFSLNIRDSDADNDDFGIRLIASEDGTFSDGITAMLLDTNDIMQVEMWYLVTATIDTINNNASLYVDGVLIASEDISYLSGIYTGTTSEFMLGSTAEGSTRRLIGTIDDVSIWNRSLTNDEVLNLYNRQKGEYINEGKYSYEVNTTINSISYEGINGTGEADIYFNGNFYYINMTGDSDTTPIVYNVSVDYNAPSIYTSIKHFDLEIENITFDSAIPITLEEVMFNISTAQVFYSRGSFNTIKFNHPATTDLYMIEDINGEEQYDSLLRSMSLSSGWGVVNKPITCKEMNIGENNQTIQVYETAQGGVTISNFELHNILNRSQAGNDIYTNFVNDTFTFSSLTYEPVYNFTITKSVEAFSILDVAHTFTSTGDDTVRCYVNNGLDQTLPYGVHLPATGDARSSGTAHIFNETNLEENMTLWCKSDLGETIVNDITILTFADRDEAGNLINQIHGETWNQTLGAGTHEILNLTNFPIVGDGDELETIITNTFYSLSGNQLVELYIQGGGQEGPHYLRELADNTDLATAKVYSSYPFTQGDVINGSMIVVVEPGETLVVETTSAVLYESTNIDTTIGNLHPIVFIDIPDNGSNVSGRNQQINFSVTDLNGNLDYCNVTIHNSDGSLNTLIDSDATSPVLINWTDFAIDTNYIIKTSCIDTQSLVGSDNVTVTNRAGSMTSVDIYDYPATTTQNIVFDVTSNYTCNGFNCIDVYRVINNPPSNCVLQGGETNVKLLGDINSSHGYIETISYVCSLVETINLNISVNSSTSVTVSDEVSINIIQASILTPDEESCLFNGTYVNGTTCAVGEAAEELNMIGLIFGFFVIICFFTFLGTALKGFGVKVCMYGIALINVVTVAFVMYARQTDIDLALFLRTNFYTLLIIGFGIGMTALIMLVISLMNVAKQPKDDAADPKWGV